MSDPGSSDVHTDATMGSGRSRAKRAMPPTATAPTRDCPNCGRTFGGGYKKCPECGMSTSDMDATEELEKAMGFGKFPADLPPSSGTKFTPDPRLHSHAFAPDPAHPNKCAQCGMGTGVHSRMVNREPKPPADGDGDTPATKSRFRQLLDRAAELIGAPTTPDDDDLVPFVKAASESRFTFAPVYMPRRYDAHGDFVDSPDDLQKAAWGYVESTGADRTVYLQHSDHPAGKWVEIVSWPYEVTAPMMIPDPSGNITKARRVTTLPAGTVYMGVVWEPWAFDEVKKGKLRGFSLGGVARRVEAVMGDDGQPINRDDQPVQPVDKSVGLVDNYAWSNGSSATVTTVNGGSGSSTTSTRPLDQS